MSSPIKPESTKDSILILEGALSEVKRKYQTVCSDYNHLGTKIFTLLAAQLAVITFIAAQAHFNLSLLYGAILFGAGIAFVAIAIGLLFWAITSNIWANPGELKELRDLNYKTYMDYLQDIKDDYLEAYSYCLKRYDQRRIMFDWSIMLFIIGVILLMVIKFGGHTI